MREAFIAHAEKRVLGPALAHVEAPAGEFHIKAGGLTGSRSFVAVKVNGGFFGNPAIGLPSINGLIELADGDTGLPLALMDSVAITRARTAAATALAVEALARRPLRTLAILGGGAQALAHIEALAPLLSREARVRIWSRGGLNRPLPGYVEVVDTAAAAAREADVVVTCTPSREPILQRVDVTGGMTIAAVGADSAGKQELDPRILADAAVVTDVTAQCAAVGELQHAIRNGLMETSDVRAQLGEVLAGIRAGRVDESEIVVFDSTGTAFQDVAVAAMVFELASESGAGVTFHFAAADERGSSSLRPGSHAPGKSSPAQIDGDH